LSAEHPVQVGIRADRNHPVEIEPTALAMHGQRGRIHSKETRQIRIVLQIVQIFDPIEDRIHKL
jgi:hypothetical protein